MAALRASVAGYELVVGSRTGGDGQLYQPIEQQSPRPGSTTVEPEAILVEVRLEVVASNGLLVCAAQPALAQRGDPVDGRQKLMSLLTRAGDDAALVLVDTV